MSKTLSTIEDALLVAFRMIPVEKGQTADQVTDDMLEKVGRAAVQRARGLTEGNDLEVDDVALGKMRVLINAIDDEFENPTPPHPAVS